MVGVILTSMIGSTNYPVYAAEMPLNIEEVLEDATNDYEVEGCGIYIDNQLVGIVENNNVARTIMEELLHEYIGTEGEVTVLDVKYLCPVEFKKELVKFSQIQSSDELKKILSKREQGLVYTVKSGDTWELLAKKFARSKESLISENPSATLGIGSQVIIPSLKSLIEVESFEETTYKEPVPFETEEIYSEDYVKGQRVVVTPGEKGKSDVTAEVNRLNGEKTEHTVKSTSIIEEPKAEVVLVGTRETAATGTFIVPANGRLTSGFGGRWGRFHYGVDIANSVGTSVLASDGGVVVTANSNGGTYGKYINIDHQNGHVTRYAHLSQIEVEVGEVVSQGQIIGLMGNTGRSTGPHLHFEVLVHGENKDPQNYISI